MIFERGRIDTTGEVSLDELGLRSPDRVEYGPSGWLYHRRAMRGVSVRPTDVLIDIGSGKGRMVYLMARNYQFARVMGVELADQLTQIARANIAESLPKLRCRNVELVTADASEYDIPDDVTHVYLFNPFVGDLFGAVIDNIVRSLDRRPRDLVLIYAKPLMDKEVLATGRFKQVRQSDGVRQDVAHRINVYESVQPSTAEPSRSEPSGA